MDKRIKLLKLLEDDKLNSVYYHLQQVEENH